MLVALNGDRCNLSAKGDPPELFRVDEKTYGQDYRGHLLQQYKLCVEMANHVSARRALANTFFLTASTIFVSVIGYMIGRAFAAPSHYDIATAATVTAGSIAFSIAWWMALKSYDQLNSGKFQIIHLLETKLPAAAFQAEWNVLGGGKDPSKYRPLSYVERIMPLVFIAIYGALLVVWIRVNLG
jgi:hypothetical protein